MRTTLSASLSLGSLEDQFYRADGNGLRKPGSLGVTVL